MWLWRLVIAEPQICDADGLNRLTLCQIADAHELLDLRELAAQRAADKRERDRAAAQRQPQGGRR